MRLSRLIGALCAVGFPLLSTLSHAELIDRGGGLIYDDVLDITWLQDTNYPLTNGDDDGRMTWTEANAWAAGLSYYDVVRDVTYDDWRLPTMSPIDGNSFNTTITNNGTSDLGFARTTTDGSDGGWRDSSGTPVSELGYMYYVNLGNFSKCDEDLSGCTTTTRDWGLNNTGLFTNFSHITIESILGRYATGTDFFNETDVGLSDDYSFNFNITNGEQLLKRKDTGFGNLAAWAVRDGDAAAVLSGTIKTADSTDICAMVLASGQFMFSCNPTGVLSLTGLPREKDGTIKRQIYADGFFPKIDILTGASNDAVVMENSGACPSYNTPYDPAFVPGSTGNRINISGKVMLQSSETPICAMVLANGQHMFSCDGSGSFALNIPLDNNGQFKLQVYADGFAPTIQTFDEFQTTNDVHMAQAVECQAP